MSPELLQKQTSLSNNELTFIRILLKDAELQEGFVLPDGAEFREKDTDGFFCMDKNMTINEIKYDEEVCIFYIK